MYNFVDNAFSPFHIASKHSVFIPIQSTHKQFIIVSLRFYYIHYFLLKIIEVSYNLL